MSRKLVSIVTGTWQRHGLLMGAIENVRAQTYRPLEHVIVSDGPDVDLRRMVTGLALSANGLRLSDDGWPVLVDREDPGYSLSFAELGFWSSGLFTNSMSAAPFMVAQLLARGEYQITLSDDERFLDPDALTKLVDALEASNADFAYSKAELTFVWNHPAQIIGRDPPISGQITQFLYRREALDKGMLFRTHVGAETDWDSVSRTMASGGRWAYVPEVLVTHRADK